MKFRKFFVGALCFLALGTSFTACSDDDDVMNDNGSKVELPGRRAYILNEGNFAPGEQSNGTCIAFYAPNKDAQSISDIYQFQNGKALGNQAQCMIEDDDYIYVTVSTSKSLIKMNEACVELDRCDFVNEQEARFVTEEDGYLYVSHYGGTVNKIDSKTMKVVSSFKGGQQLEGIVECNGKLYVANSHTPTFDKLKEVLVINPQTMSFERSIEVVESPKFMMEEDDKIYLISLGNFQDIKAQFQVIDPATNTSKSIANATLMAEGTRDQILLVNTETVYDANWNATYTNKLFSFNTKTQQLTDQSFLKNAPAEIATSNIYMVSVDDETGDIYVGITAASGEGTIYRFDANGNFKEKFSAGGNFPNSMLFVD